MAYDAFYLDSFQDYLEDLCEKNLQVGHKKPVENVTSEQRTFARFESDEHIRAIQQCAGKNIVVVADYSGQRIGEIDDKKIRYNVQLRFGVKRESGSQDVTNEINEAAKKAEELMFKFLNRFEKDFDEGCNALEFFEPERSTWDKIEDQPWLDNYYGWDLNLSFKSYMPEYDPEDWEAEE